MTYGFGSGVAFIKTDDGIYDASFQSYPRVLQHFTGLPTLNFGFPGATSDMIVYMYTGLGELDYSYLIRPMNNDLLQYSIPGENDVLIIEMGSNGGWDDDYETLIDQYLTMLEFTNCEQYLILGDTDDPGTSFADTWQDPLPYGATDEETMWEEALHEAFGEHFVNLRLYLVEHGLEVAGLEATPEDEEAAQTGCVSEQLRFDETHMNGYGYYVWAKAIYEHGIELGYWE